LKASVRVKDSALSEAASSSRLTVPSPLVSAASMTWEEKLEPEEPELS